MRAPEISGLGGWINVDVLSMGELRGRFVLVHFWTTCCINCIRVIEELRPLERELADVATVVSVHSPKFPHEEDHAAVVAAVRRYRIAHPVLDDPLRRTWDEYGVHAWPTVVLVDPAGYVVGSVSGEGGGPRLRRAIEASRAEFEANGSLIPGPGPALAPMPDPPSDGLSFPGKVAVDGARVAIADTGHDRVVVCTLSGEITQEVVGLHGPQGVRFDPARDGLVICDAGADRVVRTALRPGTAEADEVVVDGLASPWDVVVEAGGSIVVAEAGRHRLWRVSREKEPAIVAGSGEENLEDGPGLLALLAQPSGICRAPQGLIFVDAESSSLRVLTDIGSVATLIGTGLFDWGSEDGPAGIGRLQHPLGVAAAPDGVSVYVADTFNSAVRMWSGVDGELRTLPVPGLSEPGGLDALPDGRLVVADTNNHRVVLVDLGADTVTTILAGEPEPAADDPALVWVPTDGQLSLAWAADATAAELDRSNGPPVRVSVSADPPSLLAPGPRVWAEDAVAGAISVAVGPSAGEGSVTVEVTAAVCDDAVCRVTTTTATHPVRLT